MKKIVLVRHGETDVNAIGRMHEEEHDDVEGLNDLGVEHIKEAALQMQDVEILICSPLLRAVQSAEILAQELGVEVEVDDRLRERNWGEWSGMEWMEIATHLDDLSLEARYLFTPPDGESWKTFEERLQLVVDDLTRRPESVIGVVTHGGVMRAMMPVLKNEPKESSFAYDFANGEVVAVDLET